MAKKILIVDDESDMAEVTKARLESSGYTVSIAASAEEALAWLKKNKTDLILLDLLLPNMQGDEVCMLLKSHEKLKHLPIILFTASASNIPQLAKDICADDYVMKPFEPSELLSKIKKFIS